MPTKDLVADFSGAVNGVRTTITCSITSGTKALAIVSGVNPFAAGDVGKAILLYGAGSAGSRSDVALLSTITAVSGANITINDNALTTLSSASVEVLFGTDNTTPLNNFNTWALTQNPSPVTLTVPAGVVVTNMTGSIRPFKGIKFLTVQGAGKALTSFAQLDSGQLYFGGSDPVNHNGLTDAGGNSARIYTALAGATTIQLKDITYASKFAANRYIKITGFDMQGINNQPYGYPPNPFYYEDNYITSIAGDTFNLLNPLANTYKETWPNWNSGDRTFEADPGGPATVYMPDASYDTEITLNDFTIDNPHFQSVAHGRKVILNRVSNTGGTGIYPTQNGYFEANSTDWPNANLEMDKINGTIIFDACTVNIMHFQSATPDLCTIRNGCTIAQLSGTPKRLIASDSTIPIIRVGPAAFGRCDEASFTNISGITSFGSGSASLVGLHGGGTSATMTMTGGVISFAKSQNDGVAQENPTRVLVPGTWITLDDKLIVRVVDVTEDGTNVYIQTNLSGTWPFTVSTIKVHPAPRITVRGCTGTAPELEDLNQAPARIPLYSYSKRTYVIGASSTTAANKPHMIGQLVTAKFNVTTAYVAAGALGFHESQFDNWTTYKSDYSTFSFPPFINMKVAGLRVMNAATTAAGTQSLDTGLDLTTPGQIWFAGDSNSGPASTATVSNGETPTITVEFTMDQGIPPAVPTAVVPLRFRLHA